MALSKSVEPEQEGIGATLAGERIDELACGLAEQLGARHRFALAKGGSHRLRNRTSIGRDLRAVVPGESDQADGGDGGGPSVHKGIAAAAEPFKLVGLEEAGDLEARVSWDSEAKAGVVPT